MSNSLYCIKRNNKFSSGGLFPTWQPVPRMWDLKGILMHLSLDSKLSSQMYKTKNVELFEVSRDSFRIFKKHKIEVFLKDPRITPEYSREHTKAVILAFIDISTEEQKLLEKYPNIRQLIKEL